MNTFFQRGFTSIGFFLLAIVIAVGFTQCGTNFTTGASTGSSPTVSTHTPGSSVGTMDVCTITPVAPSPSAIGEHELNSQLNSPAFEFGFGGSNAVNSKVTIDTSGNVETTGIFHTSNSHHQLSKRTLECLLRLAEADGIFSLPNYIGAYSTVLETPTVFITIHTLTGTKTVSKPGNGVHNAAFDQFYVTLEKAIQ
jgi:hypothetical protein